jgi:hypothetical protein
MFWGDRNGDFCRLIFNNGWSLAQLFFLGLAQAGSPAILIGGGLKDHK